jgi:hypothetical protein
MAYLQPLQLEAILFAEHLKYLLSRPHAYFSSKHKLLLGNIIYSFYRLCSVEFIPRDIQMVKIPNTLIAENASETLCNSLRTNPSTQPKATKQNILEFTQLDILLYTNVKLLPRGKTHQLCTIVRGLRFAANVLKVSSLRCENSNMSHASVFK